MAFDTSFKMKGRFFSCPLTTILSYPSQSFAVKTNFEKTAGIDHCFLGLNWSANLCFAAFEILQKPFQAYSRALHNSRTQFRADAISKNSLILMNDAFYC